ncbi:SAM-dependent methyltransferase [Amycolatopsis sp. PS_44_ISF1]|uniref:SAM-dependent methyltransferase n=1 Tax=Amycolatopsis sp. PS_44_ISF1 TaxID=2974917 RepID=UPI0028E099B0|nr:SAM-dependent methyltransferase [Amycolatopsis sp. PS_44_ISF1]MDT8913249.1 SAM-dependent methyltransferase [Amycolatopsis sp. PS_44_ISF1]
MDEDPFPPPDIDLSHPSVARIYDYYLGGRTNWEIDRQFGDRILGEFPIIKPIAQANRMFLHRVVRYLVRRGVRQFVDIGSGVPTMGHAHEVAENLAPGEVRVAYVDYEPVAVAHSRSLLREHGDPDRHTVIHADMRDPDRLWAQIQDTGIIDLNQPVALLLIAVLHVQQPSAPDSGIEADLGPSLVARYRELLAPGSYLALSHATDDGVPPHYKDMLARLKVSYDASSSPIIYRDREEITRLLGDFELVEPGLVWTAEWHPEQAEPDEVAVSFESPSESTVLAGVARK